MSLALRNKRAWKEGESEPVVIVSVLNGWAEGPRFGTITAHPLTPPQEMALLYFMANAHRWGREVLLLIGIKNIRPRMQR